MKYTNKFDLSDISKAMLLYSNYDIKKANINTLTASEISNSNKQIILTKRHKEDCIQDISGMINMVFGSMLHQWSENSLIQLMEKNQNFKDRFILEKRLEYEVNGINISGKFDVYDTLNNVLYDFKTNTIAGYKNYPKGKRDYIIQTNIYKWLIEFTTGYIVKDIKLINVLKDWRPAESYKENNYPAIPIMEHSIEIWNSDYTMDYLSNKVKSYKEDLLKEDDDIEECKERWNNKRCKNYCICNKFCNYYKKIIK